MSEEINLYNLTLAELKEQARILGIDIKGSITSDVLRKKIQDLVSGEKVVEDVQLEAKSGWKTIVIAESDRDQQPVFVGVNGKNYRIRRGEPVLVPPEVVSVLKDANQVVINPKDGSKRTVPSYPFRVEA